MNPDQLITLVAAARSYASLLNPNSKVREEILAAARAALEDAGVKVDG